MEHSHRSEDPGERDLVITLVLNFIITIAEVAGGMLSGSLALLSDAMHNFSDGIAVLVSAIAIRLSKRPRTRKHTFGLKRAEIIAATINASTLIIISFFLIKEAIERMFNPTPVAGTLMLAVAVVGLIANLVCTILLKRGSAHNINVRAAYLHLFSDTVASVAVIMGALCIMLFDVHWIDPVLTVIISLYILKETYAIVKESVDVIMMTSPPEIDISEVQRAIEAMPGVRNIHHVHLWRLGDADIHFEAHIDVDDMSVSQTGVLKQAIEKVLCEGCRITHTTLQFECDACSRKGLIEE